MQGQTPLQNEITTLFPRVNISSEINLGCDQIYGYLCVGIGLNKDILKWK